MTPKEKAEELVQEFMDIKHIKLSDYSMIGWPTAKHCALVVCKNVLANTDSDTTKEFWNNVKEEIENL